MVIENKVLNKKEQVVLYEEQKGVAIVTLNRPEQHNALSKLLLKSLESIFESIKGNDNIKSVVIFANGPSFCSGHDLKEMRQKSSKYEYKELFELCSKVMTNIVRLPKPVIAGVQGTATAAGCQLVASCDLAIASKNSKFATPGVNIGLFCSTPMVALSRNVHRKHAMEMLLLGDLIDADKAIEIGLINRSVKSEHLKEETLSLAFKIASKSSTVLAIGKEAFYKQLEMDLELAYKYTTKTMTLNMLEQDAIEGINAFIERRPPNWNKK